jgi:hypothetical protein
VKLTKGRVRAANTRHPGLLRRLVADDKILLDQDGHVGGVLAGGTRAVLTFGFVLNAGQRTGDQTVAMLTGEAHQLFTVRGGQQWDRARGGSYSSALMV